MMEFIFIPFQGIVDNIIANPLEFCCVADHMIPESGLPLKF